VDEMNLHRAIHGVGAIAVLHPASATRPEDVYDLAIATFAYNRSTGVVGGLLESYAALLDCAELPEEALELGIPLQLVRGQSLDVDAANRLLQKADLILVRTPRTTRPILEGIPGLKPPHGAIWGALNHLAEDSRMRALDEVIQGVAFLRTPRNPEGTTVLADLLKRMSA